MSDHDPERRRKPFGSKTQAQRFMIFRGMHTPDYLKTVMEHYGDKPLKTIEVQSADGKDFWIKYAWSDESTLTERKET